MITNKLDILNQNAKLLNLIDLKAVQFGDCLYLVNNNIKNKTMLFLINVTDSYYGMKFSGDYAENNIKIFIKDNSQTIILKKASLSLVIKKETINGKDTTILETNNFIGGKEYTNYILIGDDMIEYSFELFNQRVKLYSSEKNREKVKYCEQDGISYFNFIIDKSSQNEIKINASNLPYFNVYYVKKEKKKNYYQKLFFNNSHIKEIIELLEQEMIKYFPNLREYLKEFQIYKNFNTAINSRVSKNSDNLLIDNLIYDGKAIKTLKLKKD